MVETFPPGGLPLVWRVPLNPGFSSPTIVNGRVFVTDMAYSELRRLTGEGRLIEGEFRPGGTRREWTDANVLRMLRRRSLARLRREVEPVDQQVLGRFATTWQGIVKRRQGADALLDAIEQLQGAPLAASILETEILPARLDTYDPADLDAVTAAGEVVWIGVEPLGLTRTIVAIITLIVFVLCFLPFPITIS